MEDCLVEAQQGRLTLRNVSNTVVPEITNGRRDFHNFIKANLGNPDILC